MVFRLNVQIEMEKTVGNSRGGDCGEKSGLGRHDADCQAQKQADRLYTFPQAEPMARSCPAFHPRSGCTDMDNPASYPGAQGCTYTLNRQVIPQTIHLSAELSTFRCGFAGSVRMTGLGGSAR